MIFNTSFDSAFHFLLMIIPISLMHKSRSYKSIAININILLLSSSPSPAYERPSSPASPPSSRSPIFFHLSLDSCQLATEGLTIMHHPLISRVSIVACCVLLFKLQFGLKNGLLHESCGRRPGRRRWTSTSTQSWRCSTGRV